jgi:hypothetical protein
MQFQLSHRFRAIFITLVPLAFFQKKKLLSFSVQKQGNVEAYLFTQLGEGKKV